MILTDPNDPNPNEFDYASIHLLPYMALSNAIVEPQYRYTNKFFMCLCDYFSDFITDPNKRLLLLEASPRTGKTEYIFNIVLPFLIGNNPNKRMMVITSSRQTRYKLRRALDRVLKTDFFKTVFPYYGKIRSNETTIEMPNGFTIFLTTTLSTVPTGDGFHFIVATDYISSSMIDSRATMESAMSNWQGYMTRKQNNPATKIIIDNQRLSFYDLSWAVTTTADKTGEKYTRITFPFQFTEDLKVKLPSGLIMPFQKGEYLTERFNDREKRAILSTTSEETFNIQYQQNPNKDKGKIFSRAYFRYYNHEDLEKLDFNRAFITTDLAFTQERRSDYTVFCFWLEDIQGNLFLVDMFRGKHKGTELNLLLYNFWKKYSSGVADNPSTECQFIAIEVAGQSTTTFVQSLSAPILIGKDSEPVQIDCAIRKLPRNTKKYTRAMQSLAYIQQGKVYLPSYNVKIDGVSDINLEIVEPFLLEHEQFAEDDSHLHDDIVDNCLDAISIVNKPAATYKVDVSRV